MTTLLAPESTAVDKIALGRRIEELKKEKGGWYSTSAMADRLGINAETLRVMLKGKREIYTFELEKIAKDLKLPIERILQEDIVKHRKALDSLLKGNELTKAMLQQAHVIASELVEMAMGVSERGFALQNLGRVQYLQRQYDDAHSTWLKALEYAQKIQQEYNDKQLLSIVSANLILTYAIRKEYSNIDDFLCVVEEMFVDDHDKLGMAQYTRMIIQKERGNYESARKHSYLSLEHFEKTENDRQIGHALINVAYCEFLLGNFEASTRMLSSAIKKVVQYEDILVVAVKEYVKSLMKMREYGTALKVVEQYESVAKEYPDYWGKLQIMKTVLTDDPSFADRISNDSDMSLNVRSLACKCLFEFYINRDDAETAAKYYKKGRTFATSPIEFYEEEGF
jgi:tetratricopeptide (TPR) repeat protein